MNIPTNKENEVITTLLIDILSHQQAFEGMICVFLANGDTQQQNHLLESSAKMVAENRKLILEILLSKYGNVN